MEDNGSGGPTGWLTVAEIMAGDTEAVPREAKPITLHSNRLWPFDHSRTDADAELARRLGPQDVIVERILDGPDLDGKFLVKWRNVPEPRWEWPGGLAHLVLYKEYLEQHGMVQGRGGRPIVWTAAQGEGAGAAAGAAATKGAAYKICPVCDAEVYQSRARVESHLKSQKHIRRQQELDTKQALAAAVAAPAPAPATLTLTDAAASPLTTTATAAAATTGRGGAAAAAARPTTRASKR